MSENTPLLSVDLPAELRQRQSELAQSLLRHCPRDGIYGTAVDPLALIRADGPTLPARGMHKPALCIIAQGRKEVQLAEERYIYDPLHYLVVSVTLPLAGQVIDASPDAPYLCVRLDIDPAEITQLISDAGPMEVAAAGYRVGYESPSQFSREYSRLFGAPPLRDLARARNTA